MGLTTFIPRTVPSPAPVRPAGHRSADSSVSAFARSSPRFPARAGKQMEKAGPAGTVQARLRTCPDLAPPRGVKARLLIRGILLLFPLLMLAGVAMACPGCKEGLSSPENPAASAKLTKGWARSIYLLMWTPYLLFGGAAFAIVRSARRPKKP